MVADIKVANLSPIKTTDNNINKISAVFAKTIFYDAYNFDQIPKQTKWIFKDPIVYGQKIRRLAFGRAELDSYKDVEGTEYKEIVPERVNVIEEIYGDDVKVLVRTATSALANADKFSNAGEYEQYLEGQRGKTDSVLNGVAHLLAMGMCAIVDTAKQTIENVTDFKTGHKLATQNPNLIQFFTSSLEKIVKQTGAAKYNDGNIWNDLQATWKEFVKNIKNVYVDDGAENDEDDGLNNDYVKQLVRLSRAVRRAVRQLNSPFPNINNTICTDDTPASNGDKTQIWATNCKPEDMVLLINRTDYDEMNNIFAAGISDLASTVSINRYGIGQISDVDYIPSGCFWLMDKLTYNAHMQYIQTLTYTNADLAATKYVTHYRLKHGFVKYVAGIIFIMKNWKAHSFAKKKKSS